MRFSVPQFIDVEDKIFGPLTLKQAVYLAGGAGGAFLCFSLLGFVGLIFLGVPLFIFSGLLAFVQINNRPFVFIAAAAFFFKVKKKLYLWKKTKKEQIPQHANVDAATQPKRLLDEGVTQSKLRSLAFSLDTENGYSVKDS